MARDEKKGDKVAVAVKAIKSIEELSGVGPATAEKLKEAGFTDLMGSRWPPRQWSQMRPKSGRTWPRKLS